MHSKAIMRFYLARSDMGQRAEEQAVAHCEALLPHAGQCRRSWGGDQTPFSGYVEYCNATESFCRSVLWMFMQGDLQEQADPQRSALVHGRGQRGRRG